MKKFTSIIIVTIISFLFSSVNSQTVYEWYQDGIIVFQLKPDSPVKIKSKDKIVDYQSIPNFEGLASKYGVYEFKQLHPNHQNILLRNTYQISFEEMYQIESFIRDISQFYFIEYAEKKELHINFLTPNDQYFTTSVSAGQWGLFKIQAPQAWDISTGSSSVIVAITDNAMNTSHPDLTNKMVAGYDATTGGSNPNPCGGNDGFHGSHVSGIAGAETNNTIGVASIGYNVSIMPVKIGNCATGALTAGYEGITWAADNGADVINMSWGGGGFSTYGQNVCNNAYAQGAILVAAAGNDGASTQFYPAAYTNVIAVASSTSTDSKSGFSQYGSWITVTAPGSSILSTNAGTGYQVTQGTSMASPLVAGLIGLMKSHAPSATQADIISCLTSSCDNIDAQNPSYIGQLGAGRINAFKALQCISNYNFAYDAGILDIIQPKGNICASSISPIVLLRNFGSIPLTSVTINYQVDGGSVQTFNWTGSLTPGQVQEVTLPTSAVAAGTHTFTAYTSNPNGNPDENTGNDQSISNFNIVIAGQTVQLTILTDCYGDEVTWNVTNSGGTIVANGGPYPTATGGGTFNHNICLQEGCYTFNIFDSYGDGMAGAQWPGCSINGNYYMTDESGIILFQMTAVNGAFGSGTNHSFCVVNPDVENDAGISSIVSPNGSNCNGTIVPQIVLRNYGSETLTSVDIKYQISGGSLQTYNWTGTLLTAQNITVNLPSFSVIGGTYTFDAYTENPNGNADENTINDLASSTVTVYTSGIPLPFTENFESNTFTTNNWTIQNTDGGITWDIVTIAGTTPGNKAAKMNFFDYAELSQRDAFISPPIDFSTHTSINLTFDHAYRRFNTTTTDSLIIYVSTNCGASFQRVFARGEDGTGSFATATTSSTSFTPTATNQWCMGTVGSDCYTVNLDAFAGYSNVILKFEGFNSGTVGNNLFIDNINLDGVIGINPPIADFVHTSNAICVNEQVTFTDISSAAISGWNWSFPGGTPSSSTEPNPIVTYATPGNYSVTLEVTNVVGVDDITITNLIQVFDNPTINLTAGSLDICTGGSTVINASGAATYQWSPPIGLSALVGASVTASPGLTQTYTVTGTSGNNCQGSNTITITVADIPPTISIVAANTEICEGGQVVLTATGGSTYLWSPGATLNSTTNSNVLATPTGTTTYSVIGTNECGSSTNEITITIIDAPPVPTISQTGNQLSVVLNSGETVQWFYNGSPLSPGNTATINMVGNGNYTAVITNAGGCTSYNNGNYQGTASINGNGELIYTIYPNPSNGLFYVQINVEEEFIIQITDVLGKEIMSIQSDEMVNKQLMFDLGNQANGIYFVNLKTKNDVFTQKLMINK